MAEKITHLKERLAAVRSRVVDSTSAHELEIATEEIGALWDELHHHADRLIRERARNVVLFDLAPLACISTDAHGNVQDANLAAVALLDVPASYLRGKPLAIFFAEDERSAFRRELVKAAAGRPVESWDAAMKSPSARDREVRVHLRAVPAQAGEPLLLFWFLHEAA